MTNYSLGAMDGKASDGSEGDTNMVRSLWSAATGMNAQQVNVDTISNNLANVNTTGYKAQGAQFKSLLYQELQTVTTTANGAPKPTNSQVGLGVRTSTINQFFSQGSFQDSDNPAALAISGDGFFSYFAADGETQLYTRNGNFTWALAEVDGTDLVLTPNYVPYQLHSSPPHRNQVVHLSNV